ncbi:Gfo/Idh/MocA family oxidoreductase [Pseudoprimorskyibacter insulae]|uniref:Inositol 2-dehydrogenase/D-chiro-inositol 3-dehydrogenase n=1 Tax=Pseudoprimorskyibacter insulae TaxID=1695997 RepID=A0A2R8AZU6_9RHOB|nr:Gfo/Idh/MocA family oxidoreductase [Pseudoprimorskyibacter insulae]SPF81543.1 Inositol 2-dehydrogenase/D-chiro-inositol 3-dehydrogenase [Pseudoprimorskyibacter insulae]
MSVRVAVIGTGVMGADHARILTSDVPGAALQVICDANGTRARELGDQLGAAHVLTDPLEALSRADVDAVLIASPDSTHADLTIAAMEAGKHVLCEKPLAPTSQDTQRVIEAENRLGERRVHVGFMRRFDPAYGAMKSAMEDGLVGDALMMHNFHRNVTAPEWFTGEMAISNSAPHEFDICRFVLGSEYVSVIAVQMPSKNAIAPVFLILKTADGQMVNIEVNNNAAYGYDVRCELVGSTGSVDLKAPVHATYNASLKSVQRFDADWRPRFADAYRLQNKAWINGISRGATDPRLANAWDGLCSTLVAEAGVVSLQTGTWQPVSSLDVPALYQGAKANSSLIVPAE